MADDAFLILAASAPFTEAGFVSKLPKEIEGQPVAYREKEMIHCGTFHDERTGKPFSITTDRLDNWVTNFDRWTGAGNAVPLPTVDHFQDDSKLKGTSLGNLLSLERRGDKLYGLHQFIGADAIAAAARNNSSVFVEAGKIDGAGNVYDEVLTHNLITPKPLIPGLAPFKSFKIAASGASPLNVSIITSNKPPQELSMPLLDDLKTALKLDATATEEQVSAAFKTHMTGVAASQADVTKLKNDLTASTTALAAAQPKVPDDYTLGLICESLDTKRQAAVTACGAALVGEAEAMFFIDKKPTPLALSQVAGKTLIGRVFDLLAKVKPVPPTGQQSAVTLAAGLPLGGAGVAASAQPTTDRQMELMKQQVAANNPTPAK